MKTFISNPAYLILFLFITFTANTFAQNNAMYLQVKGKIQGQIKGDGTEKGKEGLIKVPAYTHDIVSPRDAASGQASGKRQHKPLVITKELDKASPLLYKALTTNEQLDVTLEMYRSNVAKAGPQELYFTITLSDAVISEIQSKTNDKGVVLEDISFVYQKIVWTYAKGGVSHEDSWSGKQ